MSLRNTRVIRAKKVAPRLNLIGIRSNVFSCYMIALLISLDSSLSSDFDAKSLRNKPYRRRNIVIIDDAGFLYLSLFIYIYLFIYISLYMYIYLHNLHIYLRSSFQSYVARAMSRRTVHVIWITIIGFVED